MICFSKKLSVVFFEKIGKKSQTQRDPAALKMETSLFISVSKTA